MKRSESALMQLKKKELVNLVLQEQANDPNLGQKTKQELIDIILRKDDVEIRLKDTIKSKDDQLDELSARIVGYQADIAGLERMREENLNSIKELTQTLDRKRKMIRRWQIAFAVLCVVSIIVIAVIA